MDFINKLFAQAGAHLESLTRSQRIALGLCAAIVAAALGD